MSLLRHRCKQSLLKVCVAVCLWIGLTVYIALSYVCLSGCHGHQYKTVTKDLDSNKQPPHFIPKCFQNVSELTNQTTTGRWRLEIFCKGECAYPSRHHVPSADGLYSLYRKENLNCLKSFVEKHCYRSEKQKIPDVVHYVWFGKTEFKAEYFVSVLSALRFQQPCAILFHATEQLPSGPYWTLLLNLVPDLIHVVREEPQEIFGHAFGFVQHKADIVRMEVLAELGGIYLDTDQLIIKNLTELQNETFVMSHEIKNNLANSMILAAPGATFIKFWYSQYKTYNPKLWGYHSTFVPWNIAKKSPSLIKVVGNKFVNPDFPRIKQVFYRHYDVKNNFGLHLYSRWFKEVEFELPDVLFWESSLGEIWRLIYYIFQ